MTQAFSTLLVTGGAGFIGSAFVADCVARGLEVIVLDKLTYAGRRENLEAIAQRPGRFELHVGDINDADLVERILMDKKPQAVVNFAAESHVDNSITGPRAFIDTNIGGTYTLLEASRRYSATLDVSARAAFRFLQISTDEVYGSLGDSGFFNETMPYRPNSPYSASKAGADCLVRAWHETYGLPTLITHCTNNYGPRQHPEKLIPRMIACALAGQPMPVYGDGKNRRDWIYVSDHTQGLWQVLLRGTPGEVYDLGGDCEIENIVLVETIGDLLDEMAPRSSVRSRDLIRFVTDRPGHDRRYAMDASKAKREVGFVCQTPFAEGLRKTLAWYLAHPAWLDADHSHEKREKA